MKKTALVLSFLFGIGLGILGTHFYYNPFRFFDTTISIAPTFAEEHARRAHFLIGDLPLEKASKHYYYQDGFKDTDEFWSFLLPTEDDLKEFVRRYAEQNDLSVPDSPEFVPTWIIPRDDTREWHPEFWFSDLADLTEYYFQKDEGGCIFVGYSLEAKRVYVFNCNF